MASTRRDHYRGSRPFSSLPRKISDQRLQEDNPLEVIRKLLLTFFLPYRLYEMEMWIMNGEGVWVLDDSFIGKSNF